MPISDYFHYFFGNHHGGYGRPPEYGTDSNFGNHNMPPDIPEDDIIRELFPAMDFKVFTDPLEMHHLFEQKIGEIMQSLMDHGGIPRPEGFEVFDSPNDPKVPEKQDPRDHYLKPGVKLMPPSEKDGNDTSRPITSWLDKFIPSPNPDDHTKTPNPFSSYRMVTRKTITLPDGTVKTEEIIRSSDGSEEITEVHREGDALFGTLNPDIPGKIFSDPGFGFQSMPEYQTPRDQYLKPGYEKLNPNSRKVDKDLDKHIEEAGIQSLPPLPKDPGIIQSNITGAFKSLKRRIVTLPNGVVESEEVVRNPDGTEQRTVTHTWPDGTSKNVTVPGTPLIGKNQEKLEDGHDSSTLSVTLRGVKDFIDILFR